MSTDPDSPDTLADDHDTVRVPGWMAGALVVLLGLGVGGTGFAIGRSTAPEGGGTGVDRPILTSGQGPGGRQLPGGGQGGQLPGGGQGGQLPGGGQGGQLPGGGQGGQLPGGPRSGAPNNPDGSSGQDAPDDGSDKSASS